MLRDEQRFILLDDLRETPVGITNWFKENSPKGLAGRCLADAIEYLRASPKLPGRFSHVVNAHCIRLVHRCLSDSNLGRTALIPLLAGPIEEICEQFDGGGRQVDPPYYGDDYWDWASVVNAFAEVKPTSKTASKIISQELNDLLNSVKQRIDEGLTFGNSKREWYGPVRWPALSGQDSPLDKWSLCRLSLRSAVVGASRREGVARPE